MVALYVVATRISLDLGRSGQRVLTRGSSLADHTPFRQWSYNNNKRFKNEQMQYVCLSRRIASRPRFECTGHVRDSTLGMPKNGHSVYEL